MISDDKLISFLNGDTTHSKEIEAQLQENDEFARRLMALEPSAAIVKEAFVAATPELSVSIPAQRRFIGWQHPALIASCAALIGFAVAWFGKPPLMMPETWTSEVARYQALYIPDTVSGMDVDDTRQHEQVVRVSSAIEKDLSFVLDQKFEGLTFKRAQILGFENKTIAQLVFQAKDGTPIALCLTKQDRPKTTNDTTRRQGMWSSFWTTGTHGVLLIGGDDQALIANAARDFQTVL